MALVCTTNVQCLTKLGNCRSIPFVLQYPYQINQVRQFSTDVPHLTVLDTPIP